MQDFDTARPGASKEVRLPEPLRGTPDGLGVTLTALLHDQSNWCSMMSFFVAHQYKYIYMYNFAY